MKASVYTQYGPPEVLQLVDVPKPTPRAYEVLVKVRATTVTIGDTIMRSFKLPNITGWQKFMARLILGWNTLRRHIPGMELAGEIEAIGRKVTRFKPGDAVFASTFDVNLGGHAEYKCLTEKGVIAIKPANLIYGASGAVGTFAVQLASRHFGADVTGVCSGANLEFVKSLGASQVIDYTLQNFTQSAETYDVIFHAVGKLSHAQCNKALKPGGVYINVHGDSNGFFWSLPYVTCSLY